MTALRAAITLLLITLPSLASAETVLVEPGDDLAAAFRNLDPGDELVFGSGTFTLEGSLDVSVDGNDGAPIVIRGTDAVLEAPNADFTLRIEGSWFIVQDLEIRGPGAALTLAGEEIIVRDSVFVGATNGIVCEDCAQTFINRCELRGMTDEDGAAVLSNAFVNGEIRSSWVHNVAGSGIVLAGRTVNADVVDNVVESVGGHGIQVEFPVELASGQPNNVVANFVDDVGGSGIVTIGGVLLTTNIITRFAGDGVQSTIGEAMSVLDVVMTHNTIVGTTTCFRASEWSLSGATNIVANNAFYCPDDTAFIFDDGPGMQTLVISNVYLGAADFPGESVEGQGLGDFVDAENGDLYPAEDSALVGAGDQTYVTTLDYNGTQRDVPPDVGAYERTAATNPGGIPGGDFKGAPGTTPDADMGTPGPDGGGASGGGIGGGASGFPERDGCSCASAGSGAALLPLLMLLAVAVGRRRR